MQHSQINLFIKIVTLIFFKLCACEYMSSDPEDLLEPELVVNHPVQVLGAEPRSSAKIVSAPNH